MLLLLTLCQRYPGHIVRSNVVRTRADDLAVGALLDHVCTPAGGARDDEQRCEHVGRHAHHGVRHGREPVEVGEHLLGFPHHAFQARGDVEQSHVAFLFGQLLRHALDHFIARVGDGVDGVAETDDDLLAFDAGADVGLGCIGILVTVLDAERFFVGAAVLGAAQVRRSHR